MQNAQLETLKKWFTDFVRGFYAANDDFINRHVQLKECHTHRVCNEMRQLTAALKMDDNDVLIAETPPPRGADGQPIQGVRGSPLGYCMGRDRYFKREDVGIIIERGERPDGS